MHGFTCGIADLLITPEADEMRMSLVQQSEDLGMAAAFKCIARPAPVDRAMAREQLCREIRVSSGSVIFYFVVPYPAQRCLRPSVILLSNALQRHWYLVFSCSLVCDPGVGFRV